MSSRAPLLARFLRMQSFLKERPAAVAYELDLIAKEHGSDRSPCHQRGVRSHLPAESAQDRFHMLKASDTGKLA